MESVVPPSAGWLSVITRIETPSVSDSRMNSCRLSVQVLPVSVRNWMAVIHSASVSFTSRTKSCRCVTSEVITCLKRGSSQSVHARQHGLRNALFVEFAHVAPWICCQSCVPRIARHGP